MWKLTPKEYTYGKQKNASSLLLRWSERESVSYSGVSNSVTPWIVCSPLGTSVPGIPQERILEWVPIPFSRGPSQPRDRTQVSLQWQASSLPSEPPEKSQRCPCPSPCEYVTSKSKKDFAGVIKLKILRWKDDPGPARWSNAVSV